jgi:DNA helicase IV
MVREAERAREDAAEAFEKGVAFGRIDTEDDETWYIGKVLITNAEREPMVVHWRAPIADPFYKASHDNRHGVVRKRQFDCERNRIQTFHDIVFADLADRVRQLDSPTDAELDELVNVDDALLADLERHRTGEMQDIVQTIRAAQHDIISHELDELLVVQGGPGTGKTAVGLHRVSWLLFNHAKELGPDSVLVVGPNQTFVQYIAKVLPGLGDRQVVQRPIVALGPSNLRVTRDEPPELTRLKGERRMEALISEALKQRIAVPDDGEDDRTGQAVIEATLRGRTTRLPRDAVDARVESLRSRNYSQGRQELRDFLATQLAERVTTDVLAETTDALLERIWPSLTAAALLRELFGSERRLTRAAGSVFSAEEALLLYRRSADRITEEQWSQADIPLLDFADHLITGMVTRFRHVVVDEAQDLSPMQLASLRRRSSNGSMTILGDIAQSTGLWARDSWGTVTDALAQDLPVTTSELEVGYRMTSEIFEFAAQLLPSIAPDLTRPRVVRHGPPPELRHVPDAASLANVSVQAARDHLSRGCSVAVICPSSLRSDLEDAFAQAGVDWGDAVTTLNSPITVVDPAAAKGLEFDAVVVVEPERIVESDPRGGRLLYVAVTRATKLLTVVHHGPAIPTLTAPADVETGIDEIPSQDSDRDLLEVTVEAVDTPDTGGTGRSGGPSGSNRLVASFARTLAAEIRSTIQPEHFEEVLETLLNELLGDDAR